MEPDMKKKPKRKTANEHGVAVVMDAPMEYKGYTGSVRFNHADKVFHGRIIGIADTVTFEADSAKRLIKAFHEAVDDYLATCHRLGRSPDQEFKGSFNVRIRPELHRRAHLKSQALHISLNKYIETIIEKEVMTDA